MKATLTRSSVRTLLAVAALTAAPAFGQIYQKADTIPTSPGGGNNPPTDLEAVVATQDGGYIAVGREALNILHIARYNAAGNVVWSRFSPTNFILQASSINQLNAGAANPVYVIAGEMNDALPFGTWTMQIDGAGNMVCPVREINGIGAAYTGGRSQAVARPLADGTYVISGRAQLAATALTFGRLTHFAPGCGPVIWSQLYTATGGVPGLTGACEISDVVEEPGNVNLVAVGTAAVANGGKIPFLLRVTEATGAVVFSQFYGIGDPAMDLHGDGLAPSVNAAGNFDGYVFDGRSSPVGAGVPTATDNYVVKVSPALNVIWGEIFPGFEPCHACVRTVGTSTLLAGTRTSPNGAIGVWGSLINSVGGAPVWGWDYGRGFERGNGVAITAATPSSPAGPIIVGIGGATTAPGGFLVKSLMTTGSSGGCQIPTPPPAQSIMQRPAQFAALTIQDLRPFEFPLIVENLQTIVTCRPHALPCDPDFNGDGDRGTDSDIAAFFACLAGDCCETCGSADFNGDGDTGTDSDIASFFRVLAGGPC